MPKYTKTSPNGSWQTVSGYFLVFARFFKSYFFHYCPVWEKWTIHHNVKNLRESRIKKRVYDCCGICWQLSVFYACMAFIQGMLE